MEHASFLSEIVYGESQPVITPLIANAFTKEIRIVFRAGQAMKAHKTAFPITVAVVFGTIDFGTGKGRVVLKTGDVIALEPNVMHDLNASEDAVVRLSLHRGDSIGRVSAVLKL